jgi:hypothetical protein
MDGSVAVFDLLHYINILLIQFSVQLFSLLFHCCKSRNNKLCAFNECNAVSGRYKRAAFCIKNRFGMIATKVNICLPHFVSVATLPG